MEILESGRVEDRLERGHAEVRPEHMQICLERKPTLNIEKENWEGTKKQSVLPSVVYLRWLSYFYLHQFHPSLAHLSRPIIFAHCRLCRAVSKVSLAGVHW